MGLYNPGYINNLDELIASTPLDQVLAHYGLPLPHESTGEHRMDCVFDDSCAKSSYGTLTVNQSDPARRIYCHACGTRGNLLTLLWGLAEQRPPTGGRLRGAEFKQAVALLLQVHGQPEAGDRQEPDQQGDTGNRTVTPDKPPVNIPLKDSPNERARALASLHEELIVDVAEMNAAAAAYFRRRDWLTPEVARKWRLGYLPHSAKGLLRGRVVYALADEQDEILSYFGRDPAFEQKRADWERKGRPEKGQPMKHRFVKGFHRGLELFGQNGARRLQQRRLKESLARLGLVVVEGPNDVIRLDCLGVAAVGLCSNKPTNEQVAKIVQFAKRTAGGKVALMPDCDLEGEAGFKELLWNLHEHGGITPRLIWSRTMFGERFCGRQPESISAEEWEEIAGQHQSNLAR